ncbi:MAG: saccharopine dehydrogenase family protein [Acidimicrobiales bacterium]
MGDDHEFDIVLWGATGFTGQLTAEQLLRRVGVDGEIRWALGGRNADKLKSVRSDIGAAVGIDTDGLALVVGDSLDEDFVDELARRTRVVCSTVGPYATYGSELVAACARNGTDYCDLTGEVQWMQRMIDGFGHVAAESGARIVFTCGFDCIPSDLGVYFMQQQMQQRHGLAARKLSYRVDGFSGGASGGTIASMLTMLDEADEDPDVSRILDDPYALNPKGERSGPDRSERSAPFHDEDFDQWVAPFVMAAINTKVVRRTNALLDYTYGTGFKYNEGMLMGSGPIGLSKAAATSAGTAAMNAAMSVGWLRRSVSGRLPQPGQGPSPDKQEKGFFDIRLLAVHPSDPHQSMFGRVAGDRDPGYGSTSKMLAESAICLATDDLDVGGGCWTPASAMGDQLLERLPVHAGVTFTLDD